MPTSVERIKGMVARDNLAHFVKYFDNQLWYKLHYTDGYGGSPFDTSVKQSGVAYTFEFPVPIADIGTATFHASERAILMMRYIRQHLEMLEKAKETQNEEPTPH